MAAGIPVSRLSRLVGDDLDARVLEPSPPAVMDGEWFADDPVAIDTASVSRPVVSPVGGAHLTWSEWLADHPDAAAWASERWLGDYRRLSAPSAAFADTRLALHRIAAYVVSPARGGSTRRSGCGGPWAASGTPFFAGGDGREPSRFASPEHGSSDSEAMSPRPNP